MRIPVPRGLMRLAAGPAVTGVAATWRFTVRRPEWWSRAGPRVIVLWHEALLPLLWYHRDQDIAIVVSRARDGQYLVDYARRLGYRAIEGSSHRGRLQAMRGLLGELKAGGVLAVTPDGPRGPRRELKPGAFAAAQRAGATILTVHAEARPVLRLGSWDRFMIPFPWARVRVAYGEPFVVGPGQTAVDEAVSRARTQLAALEQEIGWREATPTA